MQSDELEELNSRIMLLKLADGRQLLEREAKFQPNEEQINSAKDLHKTIQEIGSPWNDEPTVFNFAIYQEYCKEQPESGSSKLIGNETEFSLAEGVSLEEFAEFLCLEDFWLSPDFEHLLVLFLDFCQIGNFKILDFDNYPLWHPLGKELLTVIEKRRVKFGLEIVGQIRVGQLAPSDSILGQEVLCAEFPTLGICFCRWNLLDLESRTAEEPKDALFPDLHPFLGEVKDPFDVWTFGLNLKCIREIASQSKRLDLDREFLSVYILELAKYYSGKDQFVHEVWLEYWDILERFKLLDFRYSHLQHRVMLGNTFHNGGRLHLDLQSVQQTICQAYDRIGLEPVDPTIVDLNFASRNAKNLWRSFYSTTKTFSSGVALSSIPGQCLEYEIRETSKILNISIIEKNIKRGKTNSPSLKQINMELIKHLNLSKNYEERTNQIFDANNKNKHEKPMSEDLLEKSMLSLQFVLTELAKARGKKLQGEVP